MKKQKKKTPPPKYLKIMVSSSVYGNEELLDRIYTLLTSFGYETWMSHKGTIPINPKLTALENCLLAVKNCDLFLGLITTQYGSGITSNNSLSITHKELLEAIKLNKPRWFLAHDHVSFARILLRNIGFKSKKKRNSLKLKENAIIDDLRVIDMYESAIRNDILDYKKRQGNWVQKYSKNEDALLFATAQFSRFQDAEKLINENLSNVDKIKKNIERK